MVAPKLESQPSASIYYFIARACIDRTILGDKMLALESEGAE